MSLLFFFSFECVYLSLLYPSFALIFDTLHVCVCVCVCVCGFGFHLQLFFCVCVNVCLEILCLYVCFELY